MIYVISYDLTKPNRDYTSLYESIKGCGAWWHYLESTWLVSTQMSAAQIYERLAGSIDSDDRLLIMRAGGNRRGWLPKDAWDWIDKHDRGIQ